MSGSVDRNQDGAAMTLRLNRPDKKNALTVAMYKALTESLVAASTDDSVKAIVLLGQPDCFCAGNDLTDFLNNPPVDDNAWVVRFLHALADLEKPLVAGVNGAAVGIGTTVLLHCDLVYAGENARFQAPFVNLALVPEAASSLLLPNLCGRARASELLLLGDPFDAATAHELGLVNRVLPPAETEAAALKAAAALAAKPPSALRKTKALITGGRDAVKQRMAEELKQFGGQLKSPEAREAAAAFLEKREPDFSGFS